MSELSNNSFFEEVKEMLAKARGSVVRAVNAVMIEAHWNIGKRIAEEEQGGSAQATYGAGLLKMLSKSLTAEFGQGFSLANLKNFRKFYLTYPEGEKSYAPRSLLSWTHHPTQGEQILKILSELLHGLGFKLHPTKTTLSNAVVRESVKSDKLDWLQAR